MQMGCLTDPWLSLRPSGEEDGVRVQVGAGAGYWASLLRAQGVDIVAYNSPKVLL